MKQNGPSCPKPTRLQELQDALAAYLDEDSLTRKTLDIKVIQDLDESLEWLKTFLENRNLYHKKQNRKNTIIRRLAEEHGLMETANQLTDNAVFNIAAGEEDDES